VESGRKNNFEPIKFWEKNLNTKNSFWPVWSREIWRVGDHLNAVERENLLMINTYVTIVLKFKNGRPKAVNLTPSMTVTRVTGY
jgi:hypothetical protein